MSMHSSVAEGGDNTGGVYYLRSVMCPTFRNVPNPISCNWMLGVNTV